jgi:hypothetical protein
MSRQQQQQQSQQHQQQQQQHQQQISMASVIGGAGNVPTPSTSAAAITKSKADFVQVDALVLLKILKHCQEMGGGAETAQGILTGMVQTLDNNVKRIEVTNCFGLPNDNNFKAGNADYDEGESLVFIHLILLEIFYQVKSYFNDYNLILAIHFVF